MLQEKHDIYGEIIRMLQQGATTPEIQQKLKQIRRKERRVRIPVGELKVENGVLYKDEVNKYEEHTQVVVLPPEYIPRALHLAHSSPTAGHGGAKVTLNRLSKFAYWPGMKREVDRYCKSCLVCCRFKRVNNPSAPLRQYPDVSAPFQRVHMDIVGPLGTSTNGYKYILTVIDVMTRFLITAPLRTKEAGEVAEAFFIRVVCAHGVPKTVVTDQGREFVNQILSGVAEKLQMSHLTTTPYHPSANGVIERPNGTIVNILRTMVMENREIWEDMLPVATHAYNTAYHRTIKDSPFYLLYLRDPQMPYTMLEKESQPWYNLDDYKSKMAVIAKQVYKRCEAFLEEGRLEMERYHKNAKIKKAKIGDRVFVQHRARQGEPRKLQPLYDGPFRVVDLVSDVVIKIRDIRTSKVHTLHTDRVKIIPEDCVGIQDYEQVRKAYPLTKASSKIKEPITYDDSVTVTANALGLCPQDEDEKEESVETVVNIPQGESQEIFVDTQEQCVGQEITEERPAGKESSDSENRHNYGLRSKTRAPELPNVMQRPLEYQSRVSSPEER